jgi:hypothetical protein
MKDLRPSIDDKVAKDLCKALTEPTKIKSYFRKDGLNTRFGLLDDLVSKSPLINIQTEFFSYQARVKTLEFLCNKLLLIINYL